MEESYLQILVNNENFTYDKRSCLSMKYIYDKLFLHFCDFEKQLKMDINLCHSTSNKSKNKKEKQKNINVKNEKKKLTYICASTASVNTNSTLPNRRNVFLTNEPSRTKKIEYQNEQDVIFHNLAYSNLKSSILQYYIPPVGYSNQFILNKSKMDNVSNVINVNHMHPCTPHTECTEPSVTSSEKENMRSHDLGKIKKYIYTSKNKKWQESKHTTGMNRKSSGNKGNILSADEKTSEIRAMFQNVEEKKKGNYQSLGKRSKFRLYNYTSSEESIMSFSKFLPDSIRKKKKKKKNCKSTSSKRRKTNNKESEHDANTIFNNIIQLCKKNKIFTFKKTRKRSVSNCKFTHFKEEKKITSHHFLPDHGCKDETQWIFSKKFDNPSSVRNVSASSLNNNSCENSKENQLTGCIVGMNRNDVLQLKKKRSFSECSSILPRKSDHHSMTRVNKICRINAFHLCGAKKKGANCAAPTISNKVVESGENEKTKVLPVLMIEKREDEKKLLKIQILKGLNKRKYDPGHLERMVSRKCAPLTNQELKSVLNMDVEIEEDKKKKNSMKTKKKKFSQNNKKKFSQNNKKKFSQNNKKKFSQNDKKKFSQNNKKKLIPKFNIAKAWPSILKVHFCFLYLNENYEMVGHLYRHEYIYIDFYLTYVYIKALIKLKKYDYCLDYLLKINQIWNIDHVNIKCMKNFLFAKLYEKLKMYKLSAAEYSKVVFTHVEKHISNLETHAPIHERKKEYDINMIEIHPFIFSSLDKLIGTGQMKKSEEVAMLKYVQKNYHQGRRVINFYFCKVDCKDSSLHNPRDYMNTKNEITFDLSMHRYKNENFMNMVRQIRSSPFGRENVNKDLANCSNPTNVHYTNNSNSKSYWESKCNTCISNSVATNRGDMEYYKEVHPWRDRYIDKILDGKIQRMEMHMNESCHIGETKRIYKNGDKNREIIMSYEGDIPEKKRKNIGLLQMSRIKNSKVYINMNNHLMCITSDSDELLYEEDDVWKTDRCNFIDQDKRENFDYSKMEEKKFIMYFNNLIQMGYIKQDNKVLIHYEDLCVYLFRVYFHTNYKWVIRMVRNFVRNKFSNKNILNTARTFGIRLNLIDVYSEEGHIDDEVGSKRERLIRSKIFPSLCVKRVIHLGEYRMYIDKRNPIYSTCRIGKITLIDVLHIISFCHRNYDFVNSYCLSKYAMGRENVYVDEDAILLFVTSLTNLHDILKGRKHKIVQLVRLYNEKVNHTVQQKEHYFSKGSQNYIYRKDHLDYYICGVIYFLKGDFKKSFYCFKKCLSIKGGKFYLAYIYILHILSFSSPKCDIWGREKKRIFHECIRLKPFNILPYLIYCSSVIKRMQEDLNYERMKKDTKEKQKKKNMIIHATNFLKDIFTKATNLDDENIFIYNELFVYNFLRMNFIQCEMVLNKIFLKHDFFSIPCIFFPLSILLYNSGLFYYLCQKNMNKSEKCLIKILYNNPFDIKSLNLLTHILFIKKNKNWIHFFDYSIYLEKALLSQNIIDFHSQTYLCKTLFNKLTELRDLRLLERYYRALKRVRSVYPFVMNYIQTSYSSHMIGYPQCSVWGKVAV
ncbi:hypothetical protein, conserved [Plasmodium gonderi]|uniref:Uncharacterized protein n=1 Tax=Plasmodium gonderi TaxID=77519 RepID=A0A1Y1JFB4_PLAGO|nr:hypothetical protein, conserved [Plasmodium gonderi]GAW80940.1 hypothetical protein, conserved [Plasmodium gonderi]